jgi:hypothetical protein
MTAGNGSIIFNNQLDSTGNKNLTLNNTGALSFKAMGLNRSLGIVDISNSSNGFSATSVNAISLKNSGSPLSGAVSVTGAQVYTNSLQLSTATNNDIIFGGAVTANSQGINLNSGGKLTVTNLSATNATNGAIALTHNGALTLNGNIQSGSTFVESTTSNTTITIGSGVGVGISVIVGSGDFAIDSDVSLLTLNNDFSITTALAGSDVLLRSAIDSATGKALTISSTGEVVFSNGVGLGGRLGAIALTANSASLTATGINCSRRIGTENLCCWNDCTWNCYNYKWRTGNHSK